MPLPLTEKSRALVELPMAMFLRLADGDGKMTAREMECFDRLLGSRNWCRSQLLQRSLANTEAEKAALWKQYASGALSTDIGHIAASLDTVLTSAAPEDRPGLESDLLHFCRALLSAAHGTLGLWPRDAEAKAAFDTLVDLVTRPSARAAQTAQLGASTAARQTAATSNSLLVGEIGAEMFWQRGKLLLRCAEVSDETRDVKTFWFSAEPPKLFRYFPGQFITLEVPVEGNTVRRSYTISASPSRPHLISVTVKRVESGQISNWLHDNLSVGSSLFADGPHGKFTCIDDDGGPYLFISGGSGITPVMAMSRWLCDTASGADILFLHFARTPDDLIFEHELRLMERAHRKFRCAFVCSRVSDPSGWSGRTGRISPELLTELVPDLKDRTVYLCGPVPFMEATRGILEQLGFGMTRFRQESFGGVPRDGKATAAEAGEAAKVVFAASKIEVDCKSSDYILDVALAAGLPAVFSCRAGQCGTCKMLLLKGSVEQATTDGLTPDDVKDGLILSCQARPIGEVVISL